TAAGGTAAGGTAPPVRRTAGAVSLHPASSCARGHRLACAVLHTNTVVGSTSVQAAVCPAAAVVSVGYSGPVTDPTRRSTSQRAEVGSCDQP
ncbi:MAG: hypothetical protein JWP11_782, partial [Frankiales bacterium]|nr:hypothetical protein [Frankiales bacterium]